MYQDLLFPGVSHENWQMMDSERIALTGILSRIRPRMALEIGVYYGGSLSLTSQFCEEVIAIDIDPAVLDRFTPASNVDLRIGNSVELVPLVLAELEAKDIPLHYVLIDADHSADGVRRDIELVLAYRPREPLIILMHDSGNSECRRGILSARWHSNPHVHMVQCDFVPGQIIEHSVNEGRAEVWGGFALAYLDPQPRRGEIVVAQGAATMVRGAQFLARDLSILRD